MKTPELQKFYKDKRILITGHTGFKGAWLTQILLEFGADVIGYSLESETDPNLFSLLKLKDKIEHHIDDIRDFKTLNAVVAKSKPDIIFHLAAQPLVRYSYDHPIYTYETNVIGTLNVLEAIRLNNIKAGVIITTDKVYKNIEQDITYNEEDPLGGHDPYSNSKACADLIVSSHIKSYFSKNDGLGSPLVASVRAGNVIGGGDWAKDRLIPDAMRSFLLSNEDLVIRKPNAIRPWQHVFEPLYGYLLVGMHLYLRDRWAVGAWNFGPRDQDMQSVSVVLGQIITHLKKGKYIVKEDETKHEAGNLKLSNKKAVKYLGWTPQYDLNEAIRLTCMWYAKFYSKDADIAAFSQEQINNYFGLESK